jgi:hypothetical protein
LALAAKTTIIAITEYAKHVKIMTHNALSTMNAVAKDALMVNVQHQLIDIIVVNQELKDKYSILQIMNRA